MATSDTGSESQYHALNEETAADSTLPSLPLSPLVSMPPHLTADDADRHSATVLRTALHAPFELKSFLYSSIPVLSWLPHYSPSRQLAGDLIAGITVGLMVIPQGLGQHTTHTQ